MDVVLILHGGVDNFLAGGLKGARLAFHPGRMGVTVYHGITLALFLFVLGSLSSYPQTMERSSPTRAVDGRSVFQNYCAPCHGIDGGGKGPVSGALRQAVPDLTTLSERNSGKFPAVHVRNTITFGEDVLIPAHGSKGMPIWGPVFHEIESDQDLGYVRLENITSYIESIQRKQVQ